MKTITLSTGYMVDSETGFPTKEDFKKYITPILKNFPKVYIWKFFEVDDTWHIQANFRKSDLVAFMTLITKDQTSQSVDESEIKESANHLWTSSPEV